jgi:hypothetical protein
MRPVRMNRGETKASVVKQERVRDGGVRASRNGGGSGKSEKARRETGLTGIPAGALSAELRHLN